MKHDRFVIEETGDGRVMVAEHSIVDSRSNEIGGYDVVAICNSEAEAIATLQRLSQSASQRLAMNQERSFADWLKRG